MRKWILFVMAFLVLFGGLATVICTLVYVLTHTTPNINPGSSFSEYDNGFLATQIALNESQIATLASMVLSSEPAELDDIKQMLSQWQLNDEQLRLVDVWLKERGFVTFGDLTKVAVDATRTYEENPCYIHIQSIWSGINIRASHSESTTVFGVIRRVDLRVKGRNGPINDINTWWLVDLEFGGQRDQVIANGLWQPHAGFAEVSEGWISNSVVEMVDETLCSITPIIEGTMNH